MAHHENEILRPSGDKHLVKLYETDEAGVAIATEKHRADFVQALDERGLDVDPR